MSSKQQNEDNASIRSIDIELSQYMERNASTAYHELYPGVEMIDYDFTSERNNIDDVNLIECIAYLVKGCLGAGILSMHEAYMFAGIWTSLGITAAVVLLVSYCMMTLVKSAQIMYVRLRVPRLSYPDLAEVAVATGPIKVHKRLSKAFRYIVDVFLLVDFNGTCCFFQIMMAETIKQVIESSLRWQTSMSIYILIVTVPLILLCLIRSLKYLATFSLAAAIIIATCIIATMGYGISKAGNLTDRPAWKSIRGLFRMMGVLVYSVNGISFILPIENHMKRPRYVGTVIQCGMPIVLSFVTIVGFFGYWAWGETCRSPFTIHMPSNTILLVIQVLLATTFGVTFAVNFWVAFKTIWHYIGKRYKTRRGVWERLYRALHVLLITCFSIAFPNLVGWMSFLGNFFSGIMIFVFPALIQMLIMWRSPREHSFKWFLMKNICLILFGVVLCGGAFYSS